jgi:hypothetical protein
MIFKKSQLYLFFGLILLIVVFALIAVLQGGDVPDQTLPSPSPIVKSSSFPGSNNLPLEIKPILINEVPFRPESQGGGVNLDSLLVQESQNEVVKILNILPYQKSFTDTKGEVISILIPGPEFQTTPWVLDVQIYGIDYQAVENDPDYNIQRDSFLSAAASVFDWIKSNGADPEKIIINWGDRAYIREQTQKWLSQ